MTAPEQPEPDALASDAPAPEALPFEADPADVLEQAAEVPEPDDDRR